MPNKLRRTLRYTRRTLGYGMLVLLILAALAVSIASLLLPLLGVAGWPYAVVILLAGVGFLAVALGGLGRQVGPRWSRRFFLVSLGYLPALLLGLMADAVLR